jgi:hypothetical protein
LAMRRRRPNHRLVKGNRNYVVDELATLLGVHRHTVRQWVKRGLPTIDERRPMLMLGRDVIAFLAERRSKNKRPCRPGEMYCMRCRCPRRPARDLVDYHSQTALLGNLSGICPVCESLIHRRVSLAKLDQALGGHLKTGQTPTAENRPKAMTVRTS